MSRRRFRKLLPLVTTLVLILPLLLALAAPVSAATVTVCPAGPPTCDYATITLAVAGETYPVIINVYPDTYNESVNLYKASGWDITLRGLNASGTVTVDGSGTPAFYTSSQHSGNITIEGFTVKSTSSHGIHVHVNSDVVIRDVIANGTGSSGVRVQGASGNVTVEDCTANDNDEDGFDLDDIDGNLTVTRCTANNNGYENFDIYIIGGNVTITNSTANRSQSDEGFLIDDIAGNVEITGCTANDNDEDGIYVNIAGDLLITNCTANGNGESGFDPERVEGTVTIKACIARDNDSGVDLDALEDADALLVNGNIICGNECGVGLWSDITDLNLEGNWWGCDGGPEAAGCDPICQRDSIPADSTPWIDTVTASAPASVIVGEPAIVSFQFSGGPPAVYLGEGPGDLHGDPTFIVTTDNGTVTGGFINAPHGVMEVTLVPQTEGTATVTVVGPCGLDEQIVLGVQAAAADFVPEPGSVMLLASGLMGLAGYAGLRMRKR